MIKVCFIGMCGHSMQAYNTLKARSDVSVVAVAPGSEHENMKKAFADGIKFYTSYTEMLDTEKPSLAVVSPVFGLTAKVIIECANRKIDVFAEKPVAPTLTALDEVVDAVDKSGIRFSAMHYLRYDPAFYRAIRMVREGAVGNVRMVSAQKSYKYGKRPSWYLDRELYTGTIPWVGIHALDWIYAFSGKKFLNVNAIQYGSPEMAALCLFELEDGVMASANIDYYRRNGAKTHGDDRVRCVGEKGIIEVMGGRITLINDEGTFVFEDFVAPDLLDQFITGDCEVSKEEIFHITRAALCSREAADSGNKIYI